LLVMWWIGPACVSARSTSNPSNGSTVNISYTNDSTN
jgi:hypothetical protein